MTARRKIRGVKRRRRRFAFTLLLLAVICAAIFICITIFFNVDTITVSGDTRYTDEQLIEASGIREKQNIFAISGSGVQKKIIASCPYVEKVELVRHLPGTVEIKVSESSEVYASINDAGQITMVDAGGMVVEQCATLPQYSCLLLGLDLAQYPAETQLPAEEWDNTFQTIGRVLTAFEDAELTGKIDYIMVSDLLDIRVFYEDRVLFYLGSEYDISTKLLTAKAVLQDQLPQDFVGYINVSVSGRAFTKVMDHSEIAGSQYLATCATPT